jgi:lambda family phage portal protein
MTLRAALQALTEPAVEPVSIRTAPMISVTAGRGKGRSQHIETAWEGAKIDNLVSGWITTPIPINQQIEQTLRIVRARSRQLAKNDPYVRRFLQLARSNIVGPAGFTFRSLVMTNAGKPDINARNAIQDAWKEAMRPGVICYVEKHSGLDMMNLTTDSLSRDGEVIIMQHTGADAGPFGIQFRFIDPELLDVNHKDVHQGNKVRMGIETDSRARIVAYHFHSTDTTHSHYYAIGSRGFLRIPAEFIIHLFKTEYVDQLRGFPITAAAMIRLRMLNGYEEAELVGARGGAATMGFLIRGESGGVFEDDSIVDPNEDPASVVDGETPTKPTQDTIEAEAGTFHYLEKGADVKMYDPNHPSGNYAPFIKAVLRGIASGLGVNYNTLANDLEGVNFSAIRAGVLEDREAWKGVQTFIIEHVATPMFSRWLGPALLSGMITLPRGLPLASSDIDRFRAHSFQGRRWPWVDPLKDMQTNKLALDERVTSRSKIIRDLGEDPLALWDEIEQENNILVEKNIPPVALAAPMEIDTEDPDKADNDEQAGKKTDKD